MVSAPHVPIRNRSGFQFRIILKGEFRVCLTAAEPLANATGRLVAIGGRGDAAVRAPSADRWRWWARVRATPIS